MTNENLPLLARIHPLFIVLGTLLLVIVPFITWASFTSIDQISHATGQVIAAAKTQEIQASNDGVIEHVYVKEGQSVKQGEILARLEKSQAQAAHDDTIGKVAALQATLVRLKAEVFGRPLQFPPLVQQYPDFIANQTELFHRRQQALNDEVSALNESLTLAQDELNLNLPLLQTGDIGATEIIRLKRQIADLKGQISNKKNKYFQDSQAEMTKAEEELSTKEQELADRTVTLERTDITSPMNAIVKNIVLTTQGARVRPGDVIMELVPSDDTLIVEAKLAPSDLSFVKKGQIAAIKLDAYDYSIYGIFHGKVAYISPDTLVEKTPQGEKYYFRVLIALKPDELISKSGKKISLSAGMTTQVDITTGERSVLRYLTKPLTKTFSESLHER
ncbi:MAG: HlyD family efflux transporter periplasmic adaptor subunit [Sulfuricurvum sp.]|uniref:HlyD family efflux transporter periplasmic adaptor subunit n=1 Tax=Sulfuricurvum sp. TaxID=2025608 RepID=UPI00260260A7|nr:HlyD family efflux transporter periplasmic adaptor subunit [Sulfuricurvum sp.]MDD2828755.1 HlyD family efflux transporter periplasmic adaptor subunit [Sulfuricurvum sp.]MDD4949333.1 HlyD family efflux transporter periplasmic adaptor subunit [Sulfuricurvum sp.]